ncbi:MAG: hypothetical protein LUH05_08115 [Candidatus Gastranaerophilales bacterium]|nr:hypothetical protein [Candidatus Gastranaerophilales bacterium]
MVAGIDSSYYQQMAASTNLGSYSVGGGQQQYTPKDDNIWNIDGNDYSVNGSSNVTSSNYQGGVNAAAGSTGANIGLVNRLDQMDAKNLTPTYQEGEHALDLYA